MSKLIKSRQKNSKVEPMNYAHGAIYRFGADKPTVFVAASREIQDTKNKLILRLANVLRINDFVTKSLHFSARASNLSVMLQA